jgi:trimethylamine--corrinoid protein Co-methyltransferase
MTQERRTGGRRTKSARGGGLIPQLPWSDLANPYAPLELASPEHIDAIHDTAMRVLSELGIRVMGTRVMDLFEAAGAIVDRSERVVRIDESLVEAALKTVPSSFTLTSRNRAKRLTLGGRSLAFGLVAGPLFAYWQIRLDLLWSGIAAGTAAFAIHRLREAMR